jgi:phosphatidylglycerol:prolipoprotein diacylglycerol transferase
MHPILFTIPTPWGGLPIFSYGVMLGLSLIVAWYLVMWLGSTREGLSHDVMANTFIITAITAIVGSRILYILTNLDEFPTPRAWVDMRAGGLVAYGGFLGGFLGSWLYLRSKKLALLPWADTVAPTLASGLMFTRVGCYLFGCDFGARLTPGAPGWLRGLGTFPHWTNMARGGFACAAPPNGSPAFNHHVSVYALSPDAAASFPVHPTQLYESLAGLALFALTMFVWRKRSFRGQPLFVLVMAYGVWRFFIEMVRDDPERGGYAGFTTSQLISLALVPIAGFAYFTFYRRAKALGMPPVPNLSTPPLPPAPEVSEEGKSDPKKRSKKKGSKR